MEQTAILTSKFQLHIPKKIREKAGFFTHGPVVIKVDNGAIIIKKRKTKSILDLAGIIKPKGKAKHIDIDNIRDYIDYSDL